MRRSTPVLTAPEYSVRVVACSEDHRGWSTAEPVETFGLVLPRRGHFRLVNGGVEQSVDVTQGYAQVPGLDQRFAHPSGGDVCTFVSLGATLRHEILGDRPTSTTVRVDGVTELAHRLLLRTVHDAADPAERLVRTVAAAARSSASDGGGAARTPAARASRMRLVGHAREAVLDDVPASHDLVSLARALEVSPAHLSRVFQAETGSSLTRFRNRVRVSRVLARLEAGDADLAAVAGDLGFADQAHLTRTVRATLGTTPARVRRAFGAQDAHLGDADRLDLAVSDSPPSSMSVSPPIVWRMDRNRLEFAVIPTAIGECALVWNESAEIVGSALPHGGADQVRSAVRGWYPGVVEAPIAPIAPAVAALIRLLDDGVGDLAEIPLNMGAVPDFDRRVYEVVRAIPPGETRTYGEVATELGAPGAAQAVGQAMGRNPFPPIVPCHRVLAAGRRIGGFSARGGPRTKLRMLEKEGVYLEQPTLFDL